MKAYELTTLNHLFKSHWLLSRAEQDRFRDIVMSWKRKNKDATIFHEMLVESLVRLHLMEQRLVNQTQFFDGESTDYKYIREDRKGDISREDSSRKAAEFDKYFWAVMKHKTDLLKLAMANNISINITEDGSVHSIFSALGDDERRKLSDIRSHGGRSAVGSNGKTESQAN